MADYTDPRNPSRSYETDPRARHETHIHNARRPVPEPGGTSGLAFIVGGVAVGLLILFLLFGGFMGSERAGPDGTAPVGSTTVEPGAAPAPAAPADPAAPSLLEQPIPGVQTEPAPAPAPAPVD